MSDCPLWMACMSPHSHRQSKWVPVVAAAAAAAKSLQSCPTLCDPIGSNLLLGILNIWSFPNVWFLASMFKYEKVSSPVAQLVKNSQSVQETQVWTLSQEDPLEKGMATLTSILVWKIPWTEEPGRYSPWSCKGSDTTAHAHTHV